MSNLVIEHAVFFEELPSTHLYVKDNPKLGVAVLADSQTQAIGSHGRQWTTPKGNIALSFAVPATFDVAPALVVSEAVLQCLHSLKIPANVKWPNDIYMNNKKLGGILVEKIHIDDKPIYIVSLGLNLLRDHLPETATSLEEYDHHYAPSAFFDKLQPILNKSLNAPVDVQARLKYLNEHHILTGKTVTIEGTVGQVDGIANDGALVINGQKIYRGHIEDWI